MKHIILAGAPRSGKTTVSRELTYLGYTHYRLDSIKRACFSFFKPEQSDWHAASKFTVEVIKKLVDDNELESIRKEYFIFDTPHVYPEDVKDLDSNMFLIVFVGYIDIDVDHKVDYVIKHDSATCWTQKITREKLRELVQGNINFSKELKSQCEKYSLPYFDVSHNFANVISDVKDYIKNNA
ncbi:MAG: AAA family ATPase [Clostridia bacterium]|nr:AAA family ATPase [Clostridia bacterium]